MEGELVPAMVDVCRKFAEWLWFVSLVDDGVHGDGVRPLVD